MTEMVYGTVPARAGDPVLPRWWASVDRWSMSAVMLLFGIGLLLGLASSPPLAERTGLDPFFYVTRQAMFGALALSVMVVFSMMSPVMVRRLGILGFVVTLVALMLLPVFGTDFGKGAVRWFSFGFASVQPSEFLKPGFIIVSAWLIAAADELNGPPGRTMSFVLACVVIAFLAIQPDFGQAGLVLTGWAVMFFVAGAPFRLMAGVVVMVGAAGVLAYNNSAHFARRIHGFLASDLDPTTQLGFATNAIREGGLFGVGVGEGSVKWSLPDAHTDFIIAVAAEEYGLLLVLVIIGLFALITSRALFRLLRERDPFVRLAGTGLATLFGLQAIINMGVAVRL
ncbi:MAG: FtsW/RodA/SpoVE family cell cycle protein, partial [Rhodobacteraceae bacterium]|nr:FtsW/RodA/SpoVE family cell cycle protein [Paracoccaceae bacterium]